MVTDCSGGFGEELRKRRLAAGLSLTALAQLVHYSKGHLSKVERGIKKPSRDLVRLCDGRLCAGGALAGLAEGAAAGPEVNAVAGLDEEVWLMQLSPDGRSWFQ